MPVKTFLLIIALGLLISKAIAQNALPDSTAYSEAAKQVIVHYNFVVDDQSEFYNGNEYHLYSPAHSGSAYFQDKPILTPSIVRYNGIWYRNVPVLYDRYADVMVSSLRDSLYLLRPDKTSDIYLLGHHFIYLYNGAEKNLAPGFYDQLYSGKSEILVKRNTTVQNTVTQQTVEVNYENSDIIYIKKGGTYVQVNSKRSVLDVFKDKNKELKQYLNSSKISYKKDKEQSIAKLASYYDQLTK